MIKYIQTRNAQFFINQVNASNLRLRGSGSGRTVGSTLRLRIKVRNWDEEDWAAGGLETRMRRPSVEALRYRSPRFLVSGTEYEILGLCNPTTKYPSWKVNTYK